MTQYRRQYRSTPRHPSIEGADWAKCLLMLLVACIAGIFYAAKQMSKEDAASAETEAGEQASPMIPFGPFLSAGAVVALLLGDTVLGWYLSMFF